MGCEGRSRQSRRRGYVCRAQASAQGCLRSRDPPDVGNTRCHSQARPVPPLSTRTSLKATPALDVALTTTSPSSRLTPVDHLYLHLLRLPLSRSSPTTLAVRHISLRIARISRISAHHGTPSFSRRLQGLTDSLRQASDSEPTIVSNSHNVSISRPRSGLLHRLTQPYTARQVHEPRPEGHVSRRVHLD
jgi:hypothetical protein